MREYCLVGYWTQVGRGYYALGHGQGEFVIKIAPGSCELAKVRDLLSIWTPALLPWLEPGHLLGREIYNVQRWRSVDSVDNVDSVDIVDTNIYAAIQNSDP